MQSLHSNSPNPSSVALQTSSTPCPSRVIINIEHSDPPGPTAKIYDFSPSDTCTSSSIMLASGTISAQNVQVHHHSSPTTIPLQDNDGNLCNTETLQLHSTSISGNNGAGDGYAMGDHSNLSAAIPQEMDQNEVQAPLIAHRSNPESLEEQHEENLSADEPRNYDGEDILEPETENADIIINPQNVETVNLNVNRAGREIPALIEISQRIADFLLECFPNHPAIAHGFLTGIRIGQALATADRTLILDLTNDATFFLAIFMFMALVFRSLTNYYCELIAIIFAHWHYYDSNRFRRNGLNMKDFGLILLRLWFECKLLGQGFVFHTALFQPAQYFSSFSQTSLFLWSFANPDENESGENNEIAITSTSDSISAISEPSFLYTLYMVLFTELFVMDVFLLLKYALLPIVRIMLLNKRLFFRWLEYTSALYRYPIPTVQWLCYLQIGGTVFKVLALIYIVIKGILSLYMAYLWIELTKGLMPGNDRLLGNTPTDDELKNAELCAICHCEFVAPIKLKCGHIFCTQDIQTWLDKKTTCPICRTSVKDKDANKYRFDQAANTINFF